MSEREDDLFAPSLGGLRRNALPVGRRPWRLGSQFYVAAFGGPIAAGLVGYENGKRLGLPNRRLAVIGGVTLAALGAVVVAAAAYEDASRGLLTIGGVLAYLPIRELQKDADRRYRAGRNPAETYDSLWRLGFGIVVVGIVLAGVLILGVTV